MPLVLAIGGGAAAGKSTVASILREKGIEVWELDKLSQELSQKGKPLWKNIVRTFGSQFLTKTGELDRAKLGKVVFRSWENLFKLNSATHSVLFQEVRKRLASVPPSQVVAIEGAVLFEAGFLPLWDKLIFVEADEATREERLQKAKGLRKREARDRLRSQRFLNCLKRRADFILLNEASLEDLKETIEDWWEEVK
ncbi:MAG: dephospho-CoA kinase [Candidatus Atribacteria bacterium]|nr:dephospho-CoA kinase [Candidatus Atribacteria bacterium]